MSIKLAGLDTIARSAMVPELVEGSLDKQPSLLLDQSSSEDFELPLIE